MVYVVAVLEQVLAPGDEMNDGSGRAVTVTVLDGTGLAAVHPPEV